MNLLADPRIKNLLYEVLQRRYVVAGAFVAITLVALLAGLFSPRGYMASTTILVSEKNIIQPLMQGAAATTQVNDRARIAREIINGRKVMNQVIDAAGWVKADTPATVRAATIERLNARTAITNVGNNLIKIEYRDSDAERAFRTTQTLADIFIKESIEAKAAESQAAFEFIDKQANEYHEKLTGMEERLKEFRIANIDARPGTETDIDSRISALQTRIEQSKQDLKEAEIKKKSLEKQLSGEAETASAITREGQYRSRLAELQTQLETLRLSYHETYPDIVRIRHQIADLNEAIVADKARRESARARGAAVLDEAIVNNPMYQQLKRELSQTQIQIDTLNARISESRSQLESVVERGKRVHGGEATLAELTRDYQVTRDIYQDLLRRRENARVSMNMDRENQGLTFKIQEPAVLPSAPGGMQLWHFMVIGLVFGIAVPSGLVYLKQQLDPRLRMPAILAEKHRMSVLVSVPHLWSESETQSVRRDLAWIGVAVVGTVGILLAVTSLSFFGVV